MSTKDALINVPNNIYCLILNKKCNVIVGLYRTYNPECLYVK